MSDRSAELEQSYGVLQQALAGIKSRFDCDYADFPKERPNPCPCARCVASRALDLAHGAWRYVGAFADRLLRNPRERKLVKAWKAFADDRHLALILGEEGKRPSPRDWYVATTIVQWLGTNVGMCILTESDFKYIGWDKDKNEESTP